MDALNQAVVWGEKQLHLFLQAAEEDPYYVAFELAASIGMRQSEHLAVERVSVFLNIKMLAVHQAYTLAEAGHDFDDTKNNNSTLSIALFESTTNMLARLFAKIEEKIKTVKNYKDSGLVIQCSTGHP